MIKAAIISALVGVLFAGSGYGALFLADGRYVQQEAYRESINQERIWTLEDRRDQVKDKALSEGRGLTTYEATQIREINNKIRKLGGW